jgi:hypothetical protein
LKGILAIKEYQEFLTKNEGRSYEVFDLPYDDFFALFNVGVHKARSRITLSFYFLDIKEFVMNEY